MEDDKGNLCFNTNNRGYRYSVFDSAVECNDYFANIGSNSTKIGGTQLFYPIYPVSNISHIITV